MSKLLAGRYELIEKIGEGGMAVVYKGQDRLLNRYVAIKVLRPEYTKDSQFVENFRKESQAAAGLQHPNIVNVYDVGTEGSIHFIVMELIDGRPLSEVISEYAPMDYKKVIEITRQIALALSIAHKKNIIHRDVKPHNVMITSDGRAKLADFGIAKAVSDSTLASETSKIIGSVHYFSPEQARGSYVDERSDLYSLGIVMYEMLTGKVPFDGDNPVQVALMHINDEIVTPSKIVPSIPPALEKLVLKATDKFQSNRFKSADEMLEELDNIEFVTKIVGNSVFAASDVEEFKEMNGKKKQESLEDLGDFKGKPAKKPLTKEEKAKKKKKKIIIGAICGVVAVAAVVGILFAMGIIGGGKANIEVPDLTNYTYEEAEEELKKLELEIEKGDEVPSADVEEGKIASQNPTKGTMVKKGATVTVNISTGKESGIVPNLVGRKYEYNEIRDLLAQYNYDLGEVKEEESDMEKGIIISQDPGEGSEAEEGTRINIVVSSGKKEDTALVPSLTGLTVDAARQAINDAGFSIGSIDYEESNVYGQGYVMWQEFAANTELKKGSTISIKVSKGAPSTPGGGEEEGDGSEDDPSTT